MTKRRALLVVAGVAVLLIRAVQWKKEATPASTDSVRTDVERAKEEETPLDLTRATNVRTPESVPSSAVDPTTASSLPTETGTIRVVGEVRDRQHQRIRSSYREPTTFVTIESESYGLTRGIPDGTFAFEDMTPGRIQVTCKARDFRSEQRTFTLVAGETEHREDFELDPVWKLDVRVVLSDRRVLAPTESRAVLKNDLHLRVTKDPPPERWSRSWMEAHRAQGVVDSSLGDASQGTFAVLKIQIEPPIHLSADLAGYVVASARIESQVDAITLELPMERVLALGSSFACRVVDHDTGAPIPGARARMLPVLSGVDLSLVADATGEIRGDVPASEYLLDVHDASRSTPWQAVELLPGKLTDLGTLALDPNLALDVRFVDATGRPVAADAAISPTSHGQLEWTVYSGQRHLRAGPDGRCRVENLARSEYVLRYLRVGVIKDSEGDVDAALRTGVRPRVVDLRRGAIPELVVALEPTQMIYLGTKPEAVKDSAYWIQTSDGALCTFGLLDDRLRHGVRLVPGAYRVLVGPDLEHAREIPFTLGNAPMTIPIEP